MSTATWWLFGVVVAVIVLLGVWAAVSEPITPEDGETAIPAQATTTIKTTVESSTTTAE